MKSRNSIKEKTAMFISFCCFGISFLIYGLWIYSFNLRSNQAERVLFFKSYLPEFLHGRWTTTIVNLILCLIVISISSNSLKNSKKLKKITNYVLLIFSTALFMLNVFSTL